MLMKATIFHSIYFLGQITPFRSVLSNYEVLLAFRDFVPQQTKFFCLLSYCFAYRQHRQIFCHHQTKGDFSNIADTYCYAHILTSLTGSSCTLIFKPWLPTISKILSTSIKTLWPTCITIAKNRLIKKPILLS